LGFLSFSDPNTFLVSLWYFLRSLLFRFVYYLRTYLLVRNLHHGQSSELSIPTVQHFVLAQLSLLACWSAPVRMITGIDD